ncbi:cystin-1 isoform X2 [Carettochelys insculpta]|uniref:cystin-1 isoform X2 n=1 Tax=Carettochelys insculpta TaxID=44489 RepID=UPI003EBC98AD
MGSASSRSRRKRGCSPGADGPAGGRSSSAPSGPGEQPRDAAAELPSSLRRPEAEASDWELLEEVLAECQEPDALLPAARGPPHRGPAGNCWTGPGRDPRLVAAEGSGQASGAAGGDQAVSSQKQQEARATIPNIV